MLDTRYDSIVYQSQVYIAALADTLVSKKRLGKNKEEAWEKILLIRRYLKALEYKAYLDDIDQANYILEVLIRLCCINSFPAAPVLTYVSPPAILVGVKGDTGATGATGAQGPAGLATDFQVTGISISTVVDSFAVSAAKGARWDYTLFTAAGNQRSGSVIGTWNSTGSAVDFNDSSTSDIVGPTTGIEFNLIYNAGNIQLIAVPTSGTWTVIGSRYFIPNNGSGTGPISGVLPNGQVYIGNASNQATAQSLSGAITTTNTGVTSITAGYITNSHINASAAIAVSKLVALTASKVVVTDGSGFLTTSTVSPTTLAYLDIGSSLTGLLNAKMTDPMTTIGDLIYRNGSNVTSRLPAGTNGYILTMVAGVPAWAASTSGVSGSGTSGQIAKFNGTSSLTNSIIAESGSAIVVAGTAEIQSGFRTAATGPYLKVKVISIGDWNMNSFATASVAHGLADYTKIRGIEVMIRDDAATKLIPLDGTYSNSPRNTVSGGVYLIDSTNISLVRADNALVFQNTSYQNTSYNRGYITITYEA